MYPKSPAKRRWGMHRANILPPKGLFAVRSPQIMHGARILPPFDESGPCAGAALTHASSIVLVLMALPLRRGSCPSNRIAGSPFNCLAPAQGCLPQRLANARHLPIHATCQYPPLAVPVAARDKPPTSFGGDHPAHGLQFGQAPRDRRRRHLDGQADNGMLRRAGPEFQNREQVGAGPPADAAGPAGPASALPKTPIERTSPP